MKKKNKTVTAASAADSTSSSAGNEADEGPPVPPAQDGREYLRRINSYEDQRPTWGEVLGLLEYFNIMRSPADHAPSPHA